MRTSFWQNLRSRPIVVDFRDAYASMLEDVLGTEAGKILPNWSTKLELITPVS